MTLIKNNLYKLLENKNMSVNKLSEETSLSRRTLTNLINGDAKGIQFDTIQTLLDYFEIDLNEFWYYEKEEYLFQTYFSEEGHITFNLNNINNEEVDLNVLVIYCELKQNNVIKKKFSTILNIQGYVKKNLDEYFIERDIFYLTGVNLFANGVQKEDSNYYPFIFEYLNNNNIELFTKKIFDKVFEHLYLNDIEFRLTDVFTVGFPTFSVPILIKSSDSVPVLIKSSENKANVKFFFESWREIKKDNFKRSINKNVSLGFGVRLSLDN